VIRKPETLSFRLSAEGKRLLEAVQEYHGLSQSSVIEFLLREHARKVGILPPPAERSS
jgi:hypothetical protein